MLLGDLAVWLLLISLEVSRLKCTNSTLKKPLAIQHWKHLLYEHFSFLQLDLVLAAKSMRHLKAGKMLNVPQLCINMQAGTSPLVLDGGQFVLTFKIELQGKMTKKPNLFSQSVILVSQPGKEAAAQLKNYSPVWWTVPLGSTHTWTECPGKSGTVICLSAADQQFPLGSVLQQHLSTCSSSLLFFSFLTPSTSLFSSGFWADCLS